MRAVLATLLVLPSLASAQVSPAPVLLGGEYQFEAGLDGPGSFTRSAVRTRVSAPLYLSGESVAALSFSYQFESFDFSGVAVEPWDELHRLRLALVFKSEFADGWSWLVLPWVGADAESGADWGESLTYGGLGGAWYELSDRLSLGLGLGVSGRLEDSPGVFPLVLLEWDLSPCLTLSTVPPEGFRIGPGLSLRWEVRPDLDLSLIYQYQGDQHRLDEDSASSPGGIGEFRQSRVALAATKQFANGFHLTGHAGVAFGGELELQDADGDKLSDTDFDPGAVVGLEGSLRF